MIGYGEAEVGRIGKRARVAEELTLVTGFLERGEAFLRSGGQGIGSVLAAENGPICPCKEKRNRS